MHTRNVQTLVIQISVLNEDDDTDDRRKLQISANGKEVSYVVRRGSLYATAANVIEDWFDRDGEKEPS